jgi:hypothetical protein
MRHARKDHFLGTTGLRRRRGSWGFWNGHIGEIREWKNPQDLRSLTGQSFFLDQPGPRPEAPLIKNFIGIEIAIGIEIEK